jgi:isopenicillin N synthase-like dioxygenase
MHIPLLDVSALHQAASSRRDQTDRALMSAAHDVGFIQITGLGGVVDTGKARREALKRIFALNSTDLRRLWRQKFAPDHSNVYRGWFPLQPGHPTLKEGIDIGPDVLGGKDATADPSDPLREATPMPSESQLPGWRAAAAAHYQGMTRLGGVLMRSIARGLGLEERFFDEMFLGGISTMRLIHYPSRPPGSAELVGAPHVDSGLVTLLMQDGVSGLQGRTRAGDFVDVPVQDDTLVVNFGRLLELWSGGRIRATEHQVLGSAHERYSFPFFYEPRVDARIAPLNTMERSFEPFLYGDFVWQCSTQFVEFKGLEALRPHRGSAEAIRQALWPSNGRGDAKQR